VAFVIANLRADVELIKPGRHGDYYMLFDPASEQYFKIGKEAAEILSRLDQPYELDVFLDRLKRTGVQADKGDVMSLMAFLMQNNLLAPGYGQIEQQQKKVEEIKRQTRLLRWASVYMSVKFPPLRPARFLAFIKPYTDFLVSKWMLTILLLPAVLGYILVLRDFSAVRATFLDSLSWAGLAKYFLAIILLKVVHEFSHALFANHFGCKVRAFGLSLIVFYPRLFTDTTDSWRLPRYQRLLIDAAGILSEIVMGGMAALLWVYLAPGTARSTMFYIFAVSTLSTLLANGNPLIRYDGYYIVCDLLNVENLMMRSNEYVRDCCRWALFGVGERPREECWCVLLGFGIAAFIYKIFLYSAIILIIYQQFIKALAVVLLALEVYTIFVFPVWRELKNIRALSKKAARRTDYLRILLVGIGVFIVLFFPLSWDVTLPAEIQPVRREMVVTGESGILTTEWPHHEVKVKSGGMLYTLESPQLEFSLERFRWMARVDRLLFDMQRLDREHFGASLLTREKLRSDLIGIREMERRRTRLVERPRNGGIFVPARDGLSRGAWFPMGLPIGELVSEEIRAIGYADDRQIQKLREGMRVSVHFPDSMTKYSGFIVSLDRIPAKLQNSPLLQVFGGPIPVYPDERHPGEFISVDALYRVEINFDDPSVKQLKRRSARVVVHHRERLAGKLYRFAVSVLRREF